MKEIWKDIKGYEGLYQVSNLGRIKNIKFKTQRILKQRQLADGHFTIGLCKNSAIKRHLVHRLVAISFIPNPNSLPIINHKDEDPTNNCVDNLEWCTNKYNSNYGTKNKRISESLKGKNWRRKIICVETSEIFNSSKEINRKYGYHHQTIRYCCKGKFNTAYGYHWQYIT